MLKSPAYGRPVNKNRDRHTAPPKAGTALGTTCHQSSQNQCSDTLLTSASSLCWLALPEKKTITKPLINRVLNIGLPEGPSYPVLTKIKDLMGQLKPEGVYLQTL